jgi:hypothetical protein
MRLTQTSPQFINTRFLKGGTVHTDLEPFVDADEIAALLDESRRNVIRMAREGKLTAYLMSGIQRHTYKFRRSEVIRDIEKLRQPSCLMRQAITARRLKT